MEVQAGGKDLQAQVVPTIDEINEFPGTGRAGAPRDIADDFVALVWVEIQRGDLVNKANFCMSLFLERFSERRTGWLEGRGQRSHTEGEARDEGLCPVNFPVCELPIAQGKNLLLSFNYSFLHSLTHPLIPHSPSTCNFVGIRSGSQCPEETGCRTDTPRAQS